MIEAQRELQASARKTTTRLIAAFEIAGGFWGLFYLTLIRYPTIFIDFGTVDVLLVALCSICVYSGCHLWKGSSWGYRASVLTQSLQLIHIAGPVLTYRCSFGLAATAGWFRPDFIDAEAKALEIRTGFAFNIIYLGDNVPIGFGINLLALVLYLLKVMRKAADREKAEALCQPQLVDQSKPES